MTNAALRGRPDKAALRTTQTGNRLAKALVAFAALLCFGTATALADSINLSEVTENKTVADGTTLTGTLGANVKISIADGATVTLDGVVINGANDEDCEWAGITCEGGATIILKGANTVKGFYDEYPGIYVPDGKTLTIKGDGSLDASSNGYGAGIGGGYNISCGNIVIEGGTIVATGGNLAAGIGGGGNVSCGAITIADTVTKVTATKGGMNAPRSIGSGAGGSCGTVTIGGTVYPDGITQSPYIYPSYTATLKDGTEDADNWTITPNERVAEKDTVTVAYAGTNKVKSVKPVLGFGLCPAVTPVDGKTNEWTFVMPAADVVVEVEYFAVATFEVEGETYAVITNVVGKAVETPAEDPVKAGHPFAGWFTAATGGTQVTDETLMGIADTTFYAQFREPILTIENGVLTAVDFNGCTNVALTIPDTVTTIGDSVFNDCMDLASVTIPGSVKTISHAAFRDCSNLTSVTIEEGATTIGGRAFAGCGNLASITIPGTVTAIDEAAFRACTNLTSLTIPGSVKTIGPQAFQSCTGLESVTIEEGVETIGRVAFDDCENLASVTIPDSVKEIGRNAFLNCSDALYEEGTGNLAGVKLVDGWAVGYDEASISENLDLTGVRGIADGAFSGCDIITSVTIPDSVTAIGEGAFEGCDNLASVTIPDSVTAIGVGAFAGCSEDLYDTTTIPGVALVEGWAIGYTDALPENLDLTGVRGIADNAFRESKLESVTIPGTVARVPAGAFMSCSSLARVTLEEGVTAIDDSAFIECSALESVEIPDTVTAIGMEAFVACAKLASVTVPGSVAEIGAGAFGMCSSLTNVTLEAGVTNIGMMAFAMCSALESAEIPDTVTAIGSQAFFMSMNLASVTIPSSVMEIGKDAFQYTALATVKVSYGDSERVKELLAVSGFDVSKLTFVEPLMLTFDPAGGAFAEGVETNRFIHAGAELGELPEATLTGYTLAGWFTAATEGDQVTATSKMGDADATVYAQWTINQYTITFDSNGGSDVAAITNDYGSAVTAPADPAKTGYTFSGWTPAVPTTIPASNTVCTAGWTVNQYTISFDVNGGEGEFDPVSLDYGAEYGELPAPVRTGYTFLGWFDGNGNEATAETVLGDADVALAARWGINRYTITFDSNGGSDVASITGDYGTEVTAPEAPTKTGYTFSGWTPAVPDTIPASNTVCTAGWTVNQYTISFDVNGGEGEFDPATLDYGAGYGELPVPVRTGYTFLGWFDGNGNEATAETVLGDADVALAARWGINRYTITFDSNGGSDVAAITNDYGSAVTAPADPAKTGYTFSGWTPAVPTTIPASNTVCTAGWTVNQYTISFDVNGGEGEFDPATLDYGAGYGELPVPVRTGYTFKGWTDGDGNEVTAETVLGDADVTLKAQWEINQYTITFVVEGETYAAITNDYGAAVTAPEAPTKTGYTFAGWDPEIPETIPAEDLDITAKWTVAARRAAFEEQLSGDLATVADKAEAIAEAFEGIDVITNLIAEINGVTVVDVAGTVFEQIMASAEQVEVNDEISDGLKAILGMTDDDIAALDHVLVVDPFAFLTGKKVGLAYGEHGYALGAASASDICEIEYTGSKGNKYTVVADASDEEAARVFSFRKAGDAIPVAIKLPKTIALTLVKNGEETLNATLALTGADGKTYQVFRDDAYALDISLAGTVKGKAVEFTASLDHTADRGYELETALKVDGEGILGIKAKGDNTPYDERELAAYVGVLEEAGGVWGALGKVLGFVNGRDLDSLEITIRDNIVIEGSVDEIGGMLAGLAKMVSSDEEVTNEQIDALTATLNDNVKYTVTQKNTGITAEGSFVAGDLFGAYLPQPALQFEGEKEAQPIATRLTDDDWTNIARVLVVGVKAAGDVSTIAETIAAKVDETKEQLAAAAAFEAYKAGQIAAVEAMAAEGDSDAATAIITNAVASIEALKYDSTTTLDEQKAAVDAIVSPVEKALAAQRAADADSKAAADADALIAAIGEVAYTDASKALIDAAREAYDALTDAQKALVANYETLTDAEADYADLKAAADADALIAAIGEVAYSDESKGKIDAAREAYDALTDAQKALVANYETLTDAEAGYADLKAAAEAEANARDFATYKTGQIAAVEAMAKPGDSDKAAALIAAAKADIEALAFDGSKTLEANKAAVDAIVSRLADDLASCRSVKVDVIVDDVTQTEIEVAPGQIYTDEVIDAITKAAQSTATRHGQVVVGWTNYDGSEVTGSTIVSTNDVLSAVWDTVNPLVPETLGEGAVEADKPQKYEAYILDAEGAMLGTLVATVGRRNGKTGLSAVKAQVKLVGETKAYTFKATEAKGGKATISAEAATEGVELYNKQLGTMTLDIGEEGVTGTLGEYEINGSRNIYKEDKAAYAAWVGTWTVAIADADGGACSTFSIKVRKSGAVTVKGSMANGAKLSVTTRIMIADDGSEACVAVKGTKKAPVGFTLWLGLDGDGAAFAGSVESASGDALTGDSALAGKAVVAEEEAWTLAVGGEALAAFEWNGKKFSGGKAASAKVKYDKSTGVFTGSYKVETVGVNGRVKKTTVSFSGVFVDGVGYGTTTKGVAALPVTLVPASAE